MVLFTIFCTHRSTQGTITNIATVKINTYKPILQSSFNQGAKLHCQRAKNFQFLRFKGCPKKIRGPMISIRICLVGNCTLIIVTVGYWLLFGWHCGFFISSHTWGVFVRMWWEAQQLFRTVKKCTIFQTIGKYWQFQLSKFFFSQWRNPSQINNYSNPGARILEFISSSWQWFELWPWARSSSGFLYLSFPICRRVIIILTPQEDHWA